MIEGNQENVNSDFLLVMAYECFFSFKIPVFSKLPLIKQY